MKLEKPSRSYDTPNRETNPADVLHLWRNFALPPTLFAAALCQFSITRKLMENKVRGKRPVKFWSERGFELVLHSFLLLWTCVWLDPYCMALAFSLLFAIKRFHTWIIKSYLCFPWLSKYAYWKYKPLLPSCPCPGITKSIRLSHPSNVHHIMLLLDVVELWIIW